ncbi:hypothetical protein F5148DRAFT_1161938 [Russula earlei]|uniref:Uncharacterized protein n=1 Tax=Russula earlei TaxID=71964 RepID=A0ACC0UM63_9AGAM|nr:hypothetical protein F5148DRAFT_1161938 [Russula earlei]
MPNGLDSYVDQLNQILHYLGTPRAQDYIHSLPIRPHVLFAQMFPHVNPLALDLLTKMLNFDPVKHIAREQVLERPYLTIWHDPTDEAVCPAKFDLFFEEEDSIEESEPLLVGGLHRGVFKPESAVHVAVSVSLSLLVTLCNGATSCYYSGHTLQQGAGHHPVSPVIDDPIAELERELAGMHIGHQ